MIIHQDNASTHTGQPAKSFLPDVGLVWVKKIHVLNKNYFIFSKAPAPAKSPDLNPIELVWPDMKLFVRKSFCQNEAECFEAVIEFHKTLTPEYCQNYIRKLREVNIFDFLLNVILNYLILN